MAFFYFAPNAFSLMQGLEVSQSYETSISTLVSPFGQQFYEIYPWNETVPTETFSIPHKELSIFQCPTNDNYNES